MGILLLVFAYSIGYATFVENDYGPITARYMVYNARWFEVLMLLMVVNFAGMIFTKHLYLRSKWNILVIHIALIIIILGAGVTRYFGYEGQMHIREGETTNIYRSSDQYIHIGLKKGDAKEEYQHKVLLAQGTQNLFSKQLEFQNKTFNVSLVKYIPKAAQVLVPAETGNPFLTLIIGGPGGRQEIVLEEGQSRGFGTMGISFGDTTKSEFVQIINRQGQIFIKLPETALAQSHNMAQNESATLTNDFMPIGDMQVFSIGRTSFVVKEFVEHGRIDYTEVTDPNQAGIPAVKVRVNHIEKILPEGRKQTIPINDSEVTISVGTMYLELPFALKLNEFQLERYPGSNSPSSYASEVTVIDNLNKVDMPYRIYMNHILNYGGYRFFQSSYDKDEKGTVLSVNKDYWGTLISYIGYALLFGSMILSIFIKGNRFDRVTKMLEGIHSKRKKLAQAGILIGALFMFNNNAIGQSADLSAHADKFGKLYVQNNEGRIEPINTMANMVLVKVSKKASYLGLSANEVFLGMISDGQKWQKEKIIKVPEKEVQELLGIIGKYASFDDFIDETGQYKIRSFVEEAYVKKPAARSTLDKALINVDERVNVFYMVLNGSVLKIFPIINDSNNRWATPNEHHQLAGHGTESGDLFENYLKSLAAARTTGNYSDADFNLKRIVDYQKEYGSAVLPSPTRASLEIFYNKTNIFKNLFPVYMLLGVLLVGIFMIQIFYPRLEFKMLSRILFILVVVAFIVQTIGLGIRWYISDHAPWSNGYESMIYISWATVLAGFLFMKRSPVTLGITALLAGIMLFTAHMSWLNPELTNLVPVLKSYWLTFHVATITASYGFLALGCMIGFLNLVIMIFRNQSNKDRINLTLNELVLIAELALSVGIVLLVIGNFLGGIWANESWGRYWGWDPKETWTLVTIVLYAFTLHLTLIPAIRNTFTFSFFAFISFGAVLMTYFGVNYYLSGLHSYANGDPVAIPSGLYYALAVIAIITILAGYNEFKFRKGEAESN